MGHPPKDMKIKPLLDYVLIEPKEKNEELDKLGIIVPDNAYDDEVGLVGTIKAVSDTTDHLKSGDLVVFNKPLFHEVVQDKKVYLLGKRENVIAKIV